jgi:L-2-hydroxyglutarate oxidase LhgO
MASNYDYIIIGAGIIGLSIAKELTESHPKAKILILEKEPRFGMHASGRNSGVLHSGVYYQKDSLKAKVCAAGAKQMQEFCKLHKLPLQHLGKVILPADVEGNATLDVLHERALTNGVDVSILNETELNEIEPDVKSCCGRALYVPETAVVNPRLILNRISEELKKKGTKIVTNTAVISVDRTRSMVRTKQEVYQFDHLYNAAGLYADKIAHECGEGYQYTMLPVKGSYKLVKQNAGIRCNGLIYPVPDLNMPFLGVHFTKTIEGDVYIGPTAGLSLGRENYMVGDGIKINEAVTTLNHWGQLYWANHNNFRNYVNTSLMRWFSHETVKEATAMMPKLKPEHLVQSNKVGIRAQLMDKINKELVMDFLVLHKENTTHVLNAVSPAFTSAFSFVKEFVVKI